MNAPRIARALALPAAALAVITIAGCGGPGTSTIHGTVTPSGPGIANAYGFCSEDNPAPGGQVTVSDPGGKVIGTGTLGTWSHAHFTSYGTTEYTCTMPFAMKGVPAEQRYGFAVNGVPGKIWFNKLSKPVTLNVSGG